MKEKEKAVELVERFMPHVITWDDVNDKPEETDHAKQCALICVDEIMEMHIPITEEEKAHKFYRFWIDVKQEIEKL